MMKKTMTGTRGEKIEMKRGLYKEESSLRFNMICILHYQKGRLIYCLQFEDK